MEKKRIKRVLIYRLGSLGDTIVALPVLHLIARTFPHAVRYALTNLISNSKASHMSAIVGNSGLIQDYISYPPGLRNIRQLLKLRAQIKSVRPDVLVYLAAARGQIKAFRDALFFRSCGISRLIGFPYTKELQNDKWLPDKQCYEHEAARLARSVSSLGDAQLDDTGSWDLHLTDLEKLRALEKLSHIGVGVRIIAVSVGAKVDVKNWGMNNWQVLIERLFRDYNGAALIFVGAKSEFGDSEKIGLFWSGQKVNLCGALTPRESAAALENASIFIGHDSGPMHLAASVGTPCVAIFSARNKPGVWFPYGSSHRVIYHKTDCYGCGLEICELEKKKCITSIGAKEVMALVHEVLTSSNGYENLDL